MPWEAMDVSKSQPSRTLVLSNRVDSFSGEKTYSDHDQAPHGITTRRRIIDICKARLVLASDWKPISAHR